MKLKCTFRNVQSSIVCISPTMNSESVFYYKFIVSIFCTVMRTIHYYYVVKQWNVFRVLQQSLADGIVSEIEFLIGPRVQGGRNGWSRSPCFARSMEMIDRKTGQ